MGLPQFQSGNVPFQLLQSAWATKLNPMLDNAVLKGLLLQDVQLVSGSNTINHGLGRQLQGWIIVRQRAQASIYDTQDANTMPNLTLLLTSDNPVMVNIYVF